MTSGEGAGRDADPPPRPFPRTEPTPEMQADDAALVDMASKHLSKVVSDGYSPPPPLAPPAERVTWRCPTCGQPRRFVMSARPWLAGTWARCERCQAALGLYVLEDGMTKLRLAAV